MKRSVLFLSLATVFFLTTSMASAEPIIIKFSHVVAVNSPKGQAVEFFKKLAEERTQGAVKVEVYPNSQLYKDQEEMEALQMGSVHMLVPSLVKFGPLGVKEFDLFYLPFIFDGYDDLHKVTTGPVGRKLLDKLEVKGIKGLAYWDNGFKVMSANKTIKLPADMKGLKMLIQSSKVLDAQMRALGAIPQVLAFSEVYQALQMGVVDGTEKPPSHLCAQKVYEVQECVTLTDHGYMGYAVLVNKKFWEGLPADIRTILDGAMKDATDFANKIAKDKNEEYMATVKASGKCEVISLTPAERAQWKAALVKVHDEMAGRIGKDIIQEVYRETGFKK